MSSILEALKKLEDEKAARRGGMGNLAGKVAKTGRRPRHTPAWLVPGGMVAVAVVSVLITYVAMTSISPRTSESAPAKKPPGVSPAPDSLLLPTGTPVTEELKPRQPYPPPHKKSESAAAVLPGATAKNRASLPKASGKQDAPASSVPVQRAPESAGAPTPMMTVSGIAWQKDTSFRMAVVNGSPVREGGTVEGTTVKEILPDRVRFSYNGKEFEVSMEK
jgi:general secretion pathway protein B